MKNKQAESDRFIQALESDSADVMSFEEQQVHRRGQDLRKLAEQDLPKSNDALREQITTKLAEQDQATVSSAVAPAKPGKSENSLGWKLALAGCVLLTISVAAMMMPRSQDVRVAQLPNENGLNQQDSLEKVERTIVPRESSELKYENGDVETNSSEREASQALSSLGDVAGHVAQQLGQVSQQQQNGLDVQFQFDQGQPSPVKEPGGDDDSVNRVVADISSNVPADNYGIPATSAQENVELAKKAINEGFMESKSGQPIKLNYANSSGQIAGPAKVANLSLLVESKDLKQQSAIKRDASSIGSMGGGGARGGGNVYGDAGHVPATATTRAPATVAPVTNFGVPAGGSAGLRGGEIFGEKLGRSIGRVAERRNSGRPGGGGLGGGGGRSYDKSKHWSYHRERRARYHETSGEQYDPIVENNFSKAVGGRALSTFSIDVDTASYSNMRRFLQSGQRPPRNAVRIEELVNYFDYDYPQPEGDRPFAVDMEIASCPWNEKNHLLRVALKGKEIHRSERAATNLVFLLDVSGSMQDRNKLPLLKQGLMMMVQQLTENDSVSIVTYAGNAGVVLEPTNGENKRQIEKEIEKLNAGGSTNGSAGIEMAYELAQKQFINGGSNRVILATDGDLNVGITNDNALVDLIKRKASEGVFLTVLGFGTGNLKDGKLEKLADNGNGMYAYIDSFREAHKVLIEQMSGSLETIAKDVKIQIEFNPSEVRSYRLIGYENRVLAAKDFNDDKKDAGEIGAGHTVTALYELELSDSPEQTVGIQDLKYQQDDEPEVPEAKKTEGKHSGELLTLALRYKKPDAQESERIEFVLKDEPTSFSSASREFRFAAAVASFGMILRGSQHQGETSLRWVEEVASRACGDDVGGYRAEFIDLVRRAGGTR